MPHRGHDLLANIAKQEESIFYKKYVSKRKKQFFYCILGLKFGNSYEKYLKQIPRLSLLKKNIRKSLFHVMMKIVFFFFFFLFVLLYFAVLINV